MNIDEMLIRHDERLNELERKTDDLTALTDSVNQLALSVRDIVNHSKHQDERLSAIEDSAKFKIRTIWSCIASAVVGAIIAAFLSKIGG